MTRTLKTYATAAVLAFAMVPSAFAMEQELNALTGSVYRALNNMQMDLAGINDLTLNDINLIAQIMNGGDTESEKRNQINNILRQSNN